MSRMSSWVTVPGKIFKIKLREIDSFDFTSTVVHFRKFPALENFSCWKFTRWKSVAGNAGKTEKF